MDPRLIAADVGGPVWWDAGSGRGWRGPWSAAREAGLGLDADRTTWIPHRSRHVLALPDERALVGVLPLARTAGGHGYVRAELTEREWAIWAAIDEARTVRRVAERAACAPPDVLAAVRAWGGLDRQWVQLWPSRVPAARLRALLAPARPDHVRAPGQYAADGSTSLAAYHQELHADGQFDDRETTVAHALAVPHPGLGGRPYGRALRDALAARGFAVDGVVVEVGCGTGELARDWGAHARYLRVDLSPGLLAAQARVAPDSAGIRADALRLPLRTGSVACLVSNEVLADLPSRPVDGGWDNVGARAFVDEVARVLAPGGRAFLSEFGVLGGPVEEARQLDHPEVAIDFLALADHARGHGLAAEGVPLAELLGLDLHAEQLARGSWCALRALAASRGVSLEARAWTRDSLALPWRVAGLDWTALSDEGPGPLVTRFFALCLLRPRQGWTG